mgnify:CR=1 FL=1
MDEVTSKVLWDKVCTVSEKPTIYNKVILMLKLFVLKYRDRRHVWKCLFSHFSTNGVCKRQAWHGNEGHFSLMLLLIATNLGCFFACLSAIRPHWYVDLLHSICSLILWKRSSALDTELEGDTSLGCQKEDPVYFNTLEKWDTRRGISSDSNRIVRRGKRKMRA